MRETLRRIPFHTFFFIPFLVLFLFCHNYSQVTMAMTFRIQIFGLIISAALFWFFRLFLKQNQKSGIFTTLFLLAFFNYGVIYETLENLYYAGHWPLHNIHRYLVLTFLLLLLTGFLFFRRIKRDLSSLNFLLNITLTFLLFFNIMNVIVLELKEKKIVVALHRPEISGTEQSGENKPDIYYIIMDGYANEHVLNKYYSYDNSAFTSHLKTQGFYVADSSCSNYYYTLASLASTLNLNYLNPQHNLAYLLRSNFLFHTLKQHGYEITNLRSGYSITSTFADSDLTVPVSGPNEFERAFLKYTLLRLDDLMGVFSYIRLKSQFKILNKFAGPSDKPKMYFIHIVSPHPPFVFTAKGNFRFQNNHSGNFWEPRNYYTDQLQYTTTQVQGFIDDILKRNRKIPPIIILQSDHGPWISSKITGEVFEARSMILNAFFVPESCKKQLYPSISSVNTFRVVLASLLKIKLDLLPDTKAGKAFLDKDPVYEKKINF
jgi:hypothetical protein